MFRLVSGRSQRFLPETSLLDYDNSSRAEVAPMVKDPSCPRCGSENIYFDSTLWCCPDCQFEATELIAPESNLADEDVPQEVRDAFGSILKDGDSVTIVKDLKVKGASGSLKVGTKVKNIRLIDGADGHNIACRIEGFGAMNLKSEFVKKS